MYMHAPTSCVYMYGSIRFVSLELNLALIRNYVQLASFSWFFQLAYKKYMYYNDGIICLILLREVYKFDPGTYPDPPPPKKKKKKKRK